MSRKLPSNFEEQIGTTQRIARFIKLDGMELLVRLQKPFEEPDYDYVQKSIVKIKNGRPYEIKDESYIQYGTLMVIEGWCPTTKTVVTATIRKNNEQTDEEFSLGARYALNHASDEEIIEILRAKRIDIYFQYQLGPVENIDLPKPPKAQKKKT